jgi:hypothetical protein
VNSSRDPAIPSGEPGEHSLKGDHRPFIIRTEIETEVRPYVAVSAVFLYWYLKIVSIGITNDSDVPHSNVTVRLSGEAQECEAIDETFVVPFLGPHDTVTRVFRYQRKQDCPYILSGEILSFQ